MFIEMRPLKMKWYIELVFNFPSLQKKGNISFASLLQIITLYLFHKIMPVILMLHNFQFIPVITIRFIF